MKTGTHEIRHHLAVAVATIEAFIDGKLEPTPRRLRTILQALGAIDLVVDAVNHRTLETLPATPQIVDLCTIVTDAVVAIEAATAKAAVLGPNETECLRIGPAVNDLLLNAIRYATPGTAVSVDCHRQPDSFTFSVSNSCPRPTSQSSGGTITVESRSREGAVFTIHVPDTAEAGARTAAAPVVLVAAVPAARR